MGTEICLEIGGMSITYAKNHRGADHGFLFQSSDRKKFQSGQYYYDDQDDSPLLGEPELGFRRPLSTVLPRLELLGHNLATAEAEYTQMAKLYRSELAKSYDKLRFEVMSFEEFLSFVNTVNIKDLDDSYLSWSKDNETRIKGRFTDELLNSRIPSCNYYDNSMHSEKSYFASLVDFLQPYTLLRLLAENPTNLDLNLDWQYGPMVYAGWAEESAFRPGARRRQRYSIATEGSSDSHILEKAFKFLRPEIADFFQFIDFNKGHPFSGTGNLVNFAKGLKSIDIQNRTVFLLDNDAEGSRAVRKLNHMALPMNMRAMKLPDLKAFKSFPTTGPNGKQLADINGRAAAIECYLDLNVEGLQPLVQWKNHIEEVGHYQGILQHKEKFTKAFLNQKGRDNPYDSAKLHIVLDAIVDTCTAIAIDMLESDES